MQNKFPLWKNISLVILLLIASLYATPNIFGEDPSIQISAANNQVQVNAKVKDSVIAVLQQKDLRYKSIESKAKSLVLRFNDTDSQLMAKDFIKAALGSDFTVALNLAPSTPKWLDALGATPMKLGLDLRGGVHFLLEVDVNSVVARREQGIMKSMAERLRESRIRYARIIQKDDQGIWLTFRDAESRNAANQLLQQEFPNLIYSQLEQDNQYLLGCKLTPASINDIRRYTIDQTMSILRNRVNELGVGEAVVQQQGANRVAVDLPGIQDAARAKQIIGGTASLEFRMVDQEHDTEAAQQGMVPIGSKLYTYDGHPILLNNQVILSGESITSAVSSYDQQTGRPSVSIQLGGGGESLFSQVTQANIGKLMAIVYVESKADSKLVAGKVVNTSHKSERVISVATIQSALGNNFQITGLQDPDEARNLALYLRAGALPAAIYSVEDRTVGPSLGKENIRRGVVSLEVGLGLILIIMLVYYNLFGLIANIALLLNLIFLVAILSILDATLTLPGIAGIVLTIGMAVDANVLIYERIREELRLGVSPQVAIYAGYERAFSTIVDANVSTLIVAIVLFSVGTGPIKGFAVTLSIGLLTSMLTAITYTRAIVNWLYGRRQVKQLSIGI